MSSDKEKVKAVMIIEVLGKPKEHLMETLEDFAKKIAEEKRVKIVEKKIKEPVLLKDQKDFFTSYMEVEVELDEIFLLSGLMFKYMPAHIEILSPENLILSNNDFGSILNELTRRLHGYDEIVRVVQAEKKILENQLKAVKEKK